MKSLVALSFLAMLAGCATQGKSDQQIFAELLKAKAAGDSGFLIIGAGTSLDLAIIENAFDALDLNGMRVYYAGGEAQKDEVRTAVEKAQAQFQYIAQ